MIITPQQLWKDYDRKAAPLNTSVVSQSNASGLNVKYVYFNGDAGETGCVRIFAKFVCPQGADKAVLVMDDAENGVDRFDYSEFTNLGYAVLIADYAGEAPDFPRYTMYPKALGFANFHLNKNCVNEITDDPKSSCRYVWATLALRAVTFLQSEGFSKIAMLGVGNGSHQVYITCYFADTVMCGAVRFSGDFLSTPENPDNAFLSFKAALDEESYAPFLKAPVFIQTTSNEQNSSLKYMNELYDACAEGSALFSVSQKSDRTLNPDKRANAGIFFSCCFSGARLPAAPSLIARGSGKKLYYDIAVDNPDNVCEVKLFVAHSQKNSAFRNWYNQTIERVGETEYLSRVVVYSEREPVYAFVNVLYNDGLSVSSAVTSVLPATYGVEPEPLTIKRRIYDSEMGTSEWLVIGAKSVDDNPCVEEGPFSIQGATSPANSLTTFVLADKRFTGAPDFGLQLIVYSPEAQELIFKVKSSAGFSTFAAKRAISPLDNWLKITLSPSDFRSGEGSFSSWDKVVTFEISGTSKFLVNSVLWV